jgi:hypothetical protein
MASRATIIALTAEKYRHRQNSHSSVLSLGRNLEEVFRYPKKI